MASKDAILSLESRLQAVYRFRNFVVDKMWVLEQENRQLRKMILDQSRRVSGLVKEMKTTQRNEKSFRRHLTRSGLHFIYRGKNKRIPVIHFQPYNLNFNNRKAGTSIPRRPNHSRKSKDGKRDIRENCNSMSPRSDHLPSTSFQAENSGTVMEQPVRTESSLHNCIDDDDDDDYEDVDDDYEDVVDDDYEDVVDDDYEDVVDDDYEDVVVDDDDDDDRTSCSSHESNEIITRNQINDSNQDSNYSFQESNYSFQSNEFSDEDISRLNENQIDVDCSESNEEICYSCPKTVLDLVNSEFKPKSISNVSRVISAEEKSSYPLESVLQNKFTDHQGNFRHKGRSQLCKNNAIKTNVKTIKRAINNENVANSEPKRKRQRQKKSGEKNFSKSAKKPTTRNKSRMMRSKKEKSNHKKTFYQDLKAHSVKTFKVADVKDHPEMLPYVMVSDILTDPEAGKDPYVYKYKKEFCEESKEFDSEVQEESDNDCVDNDQQECMVNNRNFVFNDEQYEENVAIRRGPHTPPESPLLEDNSDGIDNEENKSVVSTPGFVNYGVERNGPTNIVNTVSCDSSYEASFDENTDDHTSQVPWTYGKGPQTPPGTGPQSPPRKGPRTPPGNGPQTPEVLPALRSYTEKSCYLLQKRTA